MNRYKKEKEKTERLRKGMIFWRVALFHEIEHRLADSSGAVSSREIWDEMNEHEKALQLKLVRP